MQCDLRCHQARVAIHLPHRIYDGHTLAATVPDIEKTIGNEISRILAEAGYRGHNTPESHKFRVSTAGKKRPVTPAIKRQMRQRSAVEPVIGHIKAEHRMGRNYLASKQGGAVNAILAAVQLLPPAQVAEGSFVASPRRLSSQPKELTA